MKKIVSILFSVLPFFVHAQSAGNDTTKYTYYKFAYGDALDRYWAKKVLLIPADTTYSKDGIALKSGTLYLGDGIMWHQVVGGGGSGSDSGFQVVNTTLAGGIPIAKFVDGSGHRYILYDTTGS